MSDKCVPKQRRGLSGTHQGRGGAGSHKRGVSGRGGSPPSLKQRLAREQNQRSEEREEAPQATILELTARR